MERIAIKDKVEKETVYDGQTELLRLSYHVPHFEGENTALCQKLNAFYGDAAAEFRLFCTKKYAPALRAARKDEKSDRTLCGGAALKWTLTYESDLLLSLLTDITIFDGRLSHLRRFCHTWDLRLGTPLGAKQLFDTSGESRRVLVSTICDKVARGEGGFAYYHDAARRAKRYFDTERFYLAPRGVAFYYPDGLLFPSEGRMPAYIVPYERVNGFASGR